MDNKRKITAAICLYSGRQNPEWAIPEKEYDKLLLLIQQLPVASGEEDFLLGYSGVVLTTDSDRLHAFNELLVFTAKGKTQKYQDTNRLIEKKIIRSAPASLLKELIPLLPQVLF